MTHAEDLGRLLRQWRELGVREVTLDVLGRTEALQLAGAAAKREREGAAVADREEAHRGSLPGPGRSTTSSGQAAAGPPRAEGREVASASFPSYGELEAAALACTRCPLSEGRTEVVFSDGTPEAEVMVVGEAPGVHEDRTGLPFVGRAGRLLDLLLASVSLSREESVYICNVLKCRPPGNRDPRKEEIESCAPFLLRQVEFVKPKVILAVGTFAGRLLTGLEKPLGHLRGEMHSYGGTPLVVTYHPAALLRNSGWTRAAWKDLQLVRQVLDA